MGDGFRRGELIRTVMVGGRDFKSANATHPLITKKPDITTRRSEQ